MCNCENIQSQSVECYAQQITVTIPEHMRGYKLKRLSNGLSDKISIDPCCFAEIWWLWKHGIVTYGCCCGHNAQESFVNVHEKDTQWMLDNGYIQNHYDKSRQDTFKLKSI